MTPPLTPNARLSKDNLPIPRIHVIMNHRT